MQAIDALYLGSNAWVLLATGAAFLFTVFICSVFSLQLCMTYFGEEILTYPGAAGLKLKIVVAVSAILFVGYAFLGSFYFLTAPLAFLIALSMVANAAKCDKFSAAIITLSHGAFSMLATGLCGFVFWIGLTTAGIDVMTVASDVYNSNSSYSGDGVYSPRVPHPRNRNVSHTNPFLGTDAPSPLRSATDENSED